MGGNIGAYGHPYDSAQNTGPQHSCERHRIFLYQKLRDSLQALPDGADESLEFWLMAAKECRDPQIDATYKDDW